MWVLCLATLFFIGITHWVYRWRNPSCNGKLPPGSMGLPLLGESLKFFTPYSSSDIHPFIKQKVERYNICKLLVFHENVLLIIFVLLGFFSLQVWTNLQDRLCWTTNCGVH